MAETIRRRRRNKEPQNLNVAKQRRTAPEEQGIVVKEPPAPRRINSWINVLTPLLKAPLRGKYCLVQTFDNPDQASSAQKNCSQRKVRIPEPEGDWTFAARGCELYAIYRGLPRARRK